jgi:hypothetical protein
MALFFAILLIFVLVAVMGVFALAMLGQSVALAFQSGTILLMQCTSSIFIFTLIALLFYLVWRQQKLLTQSRPLLLAQVAHEQPQARLLVDNAQLTSCLPTSENDLSQFLPDQVLSELPQAVHPWQGKAPWEG